MNQERAGFRWDIVSAILSAAWFIFVIVSFFIKKLGLIFSIAALVMFLILGLFSLFLYLMHRRLANLERQLFSCREFEQGLVQCLVKATEQLNPRTVIHSRETCWYVESNNDLRFQEIFILSNGGEGEPPIHWLRWTFGVDKENPGIKNIDEIKAWAKCLEPDGVTVLFYPEKESDRKVQYYCLFPEAVDHNKRKIIFQIHWPKMYKDFAKNKKESFGFLYEADSTRDIREYTMKVFMPPGKQNYHFTRNIDVGDFSYATDEEMARENRLFVVWKVIPKRGQIYSLRVTIE